MTFLSETLHAPPGALRRGSPTAQEQVLASLVCPRSGAPLALEPLVRGASAAGPTVEFGILSGPAATYPVLCGVPVFVPTPPEVVELLRRGEVAEATAVAAFGHLPPRRALQLLALLQSTPALSRLLTPLATRAQRSARRAGVTAAFGGAGSGASPLDVVRFGYLGSGRPSVDAFNYFSYRYSMPRHLVALSCIEANLPAAGPVLDVGCGAGHLTWALQQRCPGPVVGVERELFLLLAARRLAPAATFVCADATSLPFPPAWAARAFAFDVLSFVTPKWSLVRELERVLTDDGRLVLTSVKNALVGHVYGGEPLAPEAWRRLVAHRDHRLVPDTFVLGRYLEGLGLPAADQPGDASLAGAQTLTLLAAKGPGGFRDEGPFHDWPHAVGELGVNPLFRPVGERDGGVELERHFPSSAYLADNVEMAEYLPERFHLPDDVVAAVGAGRRPPELEPLLRSLAVLALPPALPGVRWPRPGSGGR